MLRPSQGFGSPGGVAAGPGELRDDERFAAVAQLAEQRTFNPKVVGSIPTGGTHPFTHPLYS